MKFTTPSVLPFLSALLLAAAPTLVQGHAYVQNVTIAGKEYTGWLPWTMPYTNPIGKSIVRNVPGDGPVLDINSKDLACNQGGEKPAALIADATAGDTVKLTMSTWFSDHVGPVTVYMANCNGNCMNFDPSEGNVWFKINEDAITDGVWGTLKLMSQGNSWSVAIPESIKAGQYLLRLELLALHNTGNPQFYPSCTQLNIKSSGSSVPSSSDLVGIPGIYSNAGKAIYGDVWAGNPTTWPVAGPAVVSWAKSGGGGDDPKTTASVPTSTSSVSKLHKTAGGNKMSTVPFSVGSPTPSSTTKPKRCDGGENGTRRSVPPSVVDADSPRGMIKRVVAARGGSSSPAAAVERRLQDDGVELSARGSKPVHAPANVYRRHAHAQMLKNKRGAKGMHVPAVAS